MVRKTVSQAPIYVRDSLTRAARMAGAGDFDGAVEVLWPVICKNPEVPVIYDKLREYELGKLKTLSGGVKFWAKFCGVFVYNQTCQILDSIKSLTALTDHCTGIFTVHFYINHVFAYLGFEVQ